MPESEFRRWYWLLDELAEVARQLGLRATGGKVELAERIAARLGGRASAPLVRRASGAQLSGSLGRETMIPPGQRSSQLLRAFFEAEIGPSFRFDGHMRSFIAAGGATLGDAIDHWHGTRDAEPSEVAAQFEYNRFTRQWHAENPIGTREQLLADWWSFRSSPRV